MFRFLTHRVRASLFLAAFATLPFARASSFLEEWTFSDLAGRGLHQAVNTASDRDVPVARWDVATPGVVTTGTGTLRVRGSGGGGPGRRTTFVDFSAEQTSGRIGLVLGLAGWDLSPPPSGPAPRLELGFVQGASLQAATLLVELAPAGLRFGWRALDGLERWPAPALPSVSGQPLQLRLAVDLDERLLALTRVTDAGADELVALLPLPAAINGLTSLRWAWVGDFTAGGRSDRFLDVDFVRVATGAAAAFPGLAPDAYGLPGLLRAALGMDFTAGIATAAEGLPLLRVSADESVIYRFFRARADLDYFVETSTDLVTWEVAQVNPGQPGALVEHILAAPGAGDGRVFARLRVAPRAP